MAKVYWIGGATAVAQVWGGSIDSVDATPSNNTFTVTIGGVAVSQAGDTDVATTAAALVTSLNGSTHPYFSTITWTNPSAGNIVATADTAGVPFVAALTETGAGTGTVTDFSVTTANASAYSWDTASNWSGGAVPANSDEVYIDKDDAAIYWGLDQSSLNSIELHVRRNAIMGLDSAVFATTVDTATTNASYPEYRTDYLTLDADLVRIGEQVGPGTASGSQRIKISNTATTTNTTAVFDTASTPSEAKRPAVRLLFASANSDLDIRSARAGVGVALDHPGETSTIGDITISDTSSVSRLYLGDGVTASSVSVNGGISTVNLAATLAAATINGGVVFVEGDQVVTALTMNGGRVVINNVPSGAVCVTTLNQNAGEADFNQSSFPRTVTNYNFYGGTRRFGDHLTITNDNRSGITVETIV